MTQVEHGAARTGWATAVLALICTWFATLHPAWHDRLDYARGPIANGELWRLVTAHLVHLSTTHAVLDTIALLLVGWIFGQTLRLAQLAALLVAAIAVIDASLWWLHPEVDRYAGLSGLLHAWFAAGATGWLLSARTDVHRFARRMWGGGLLAGLVVKLSLETGGHPFWLDDPGFVVVTAAHRWGAATGVVGAMAASLIAWTNRPVAAAASRAR